MGSKNTMIDVAEVAAAFAGTPARLEETVVVTVQATPAAVLVPIGDFAKLMREHEILRRLALGDLEFTAGEGHPLAEVLEDCDLLLEES